MSDFALVSSPEQMRDGYLCDLFAANGSVADLDDLKKRVAAFCELAKHFVSTIPGNRYTGEDVVFEPHSIRLMIGRFQRDAFGVQRLWNELGQRSSAGEQSEARTEELKEQILSLGIRVGTPKPRKTRIAAVFSLWMCVFRPVSLNYKASSDDKAAAMFSAAVNFWICRMYLSKFGEVLGGAAFTEHIKRVAHDFTYRDVSLSSLEMLYCGMFKPTPGQE